MKPQVTVTTRKRQVSAGAQGAVRGETGAIAIIVALVMVVLLTVVALVVDLGSLYDHDRELQTAADAGALAGAQELVRSKGDLGAAGTKTTEYVFVNTAPNSKVVGDNVTFTTLDIDQRSVTVGLREDGVPFLFAPVIGKHEGSVTARARAEVKYLTGVETLFPVAIMMMNPDKFRFVFHTYGKPRTYRGQFDITDPDKDGVYDHGGGTLPSVAPGLYTVTLQAIGTVDGVETVGLELENIGLWRVADPSDSAEKLYQVGMSKDVGGGTISVRAVVAATVTENALQAQLGGNSFQLTRQGSIFVGTVAAPTGTDPNVGYGTHDLIIRIPNTADSGGGQGGGQGGGKPGGGTTSILCGRYVAFHDDVPFKHLMMTPSFYAGYSRSGSSQPQSAEIVTRLPVEGFDELFTLKLGNKDGSNLYSGNWRLADVYANHNTMREMAETDPAVLDTWTLNTPLHIGGPLWPETGVAVGQVVHGLDQRRASTYPPDDEAWRYVAVPFVNYDPDLAGKSKKYTITMFAMFRIESYNGSGEITGRFKRWVAPGSWSDEPSGPLYIETAVLTE